jgi:large subunit ribosomal protein L24
MGKIKIKKNDEVLVITGTSKGSKGKVVKVFPIDNRVIVEGVNMVSKHAASPQGGIIKQESSIHVSNLQFIDPSSGKGTKVGRLRDEKSGKLVRYSKTTKEVIK